MKRDLDLVRAILLEAEGVDAGKTITGFDFGETYDKATVLEHVELLIEAGYVEGKVYKYVSGGGDILINRLTWLGHDFVQASRDDTIWNKAKSKVKSSAA
jgi:hypothetical protein